MTAGVQLELVERAGALMRMSSESPGGGKFGIDGLEEGSYTLFVSTNHRNSSERLYGSAEIELRDRDVGNVKLTLRQGVALHAVFTVAEENASAPSRAFLILLPLDGPGVDALVRTNYWQGLPPGEYMPAVMGQGMRGYALTSVLYGGRAVTGPVDLEAPESTITAVLTSRPGRVAGTVRNADQQPVPGATIVLLSSSSVDVLTKADLTSRSGRVRAGMIILSKPGGMTAASDASGNFRFDDLAPGGYQAIVLTGADRDYFGDPAFLRKALRSAAAVAVEAARTVNLELTPR